MWICVWSCCDKGILGVCICVGRYFESLPLWALACLWVHPELLHGSAGDALVTDFHREKPPLLPPMLRVGEWSCEVTGFPEGPPRSLNTPRQKSWEVWLLQATHDSVGWPAAPIQRATLPGLCFLLDSMKSDPALCLQARLEVHRFGITGYGKGKERVLEQERAIMLGAKVSSCLCFPPQTGYGKGAPRAAGQGTLGNFCNIESNDLCPLWFQPPKNSYVNYKVLQEQIKEKKAAKEEEKRMVGVITFSLFNWNRKMVAVCCRGMLHPAAWKAV